MNMQVALQMQAWASEHAKGVVRESFWEQVSNRWDGSSTFFNDGTKNKAPEDVYHRIPVTFDAEKFSVNQAMVSPLKGGIVGGEQIAKGKETSVETWAVRAFYNTWRKSFKLKNGKGPGSNVQTYLQKAGLSTQLAKEYVAKQRDLMAHEALIEGACSILTDSQYWVDNEVTDMRSAVVAKSLHPSIFFKGIAGAITRSATYATDLSNVITAAKAMAPTAGFDNAAAMNFAMLLQGSKRPLKGYKVLGKQVNYIVLLSDLQAMQLAADSTWKSDVQQADERGGDNRAITGILGIKWGVLFVNNRRSPVLSLDTDANAGTTQGIMYLKPETEAAATSDYGYLMGTEIVPRKVKGAAGTATGTCEIAIGLGAGAIIAPLVQDVQYKSEKDDYDFRESFCVEVMEGGQRGEFVTPAGAVKNFSSALYLTATPALGF